VKRVLQKMRPSATSIQALILALVLTVAASQVAGQVGTGRTVIQKGHGTSALRIAAIPVDSHASAVFTS
jgi:hypothetical protein